MLRLFRRGAHDGGKLFQQCREAGGLRDPTHAAGLGVHRGRVRGQYPARALRGLAGETLQDLHRALAEQRFVDEKRLEFIPAIDALAKRHQVVHLYAVAVLLDAAGDDGVLQGGKRALPGRRDRPTVRAIPSLPHLPPMSGWTDRPFRASDPRPFDQVHALDGSIAGIWWAPNTQLVPYREAELALSMISSMR